MTIKGKEQLEQQLHELGTGAMKSMDRSVTTWGGKSRFKTGFQIKNIQFSLPIIKYAPPVVRHSIYKVRENEDG